MPTHPPWLYRLFHECASLRMKLRALSSLTRTQQKLLKSRLLGLLFEVDSKPVLPDCANRLRRT